MLIDIISTEIVKSQHDTLLSRRSHLHIKISILIAVYNQEHFVSAAVESVLRQTYKNLELVISDDCSTDGTGDVAVSYLSDPRVRYLRNSYRLGRVRNYRKLLARAQGEWVLMLDADDYLTNDAYLQRAIRLALTTPDVALVIGKVWAGPSVETAVLLNSAIHESSVVDGTACFLGLPVLGSPEPLHMSCLYNRALAVDLQFYRKDILSSDFESLYRIMLGHKVGLLNEIAGLWRQHQNNASKSTRYGDVVRNLEMQAGIYAHARSLRILPHSVLNRWLSNALVRYHAYYFDRFMGERRISAAVLLTLSMVAKWPALFKRQEVRSRFWKAAGRCVY